MTYLRCVHPKDSNCQSISRIIFLLPGPWRNLRTARTIHLSIHSARFWGKHYEMGRREERWRKVIQLKKMEILPPRWGWTGKSSAGRMKSLPGSPYAEHFTLEYALSFYAHVLCQTLLYDVKFLPTLFLPAVVFILQGLAHCHLLCEVFPDSLKQQQSLPPPCTHRPWLDLNPLTLDSNWFLGVYLLHSTLSSSKVETFIFLCIYSR